MARSKDPEMYPPQYAELLLAAFNASQPITWPMDSRTRAQNTRQQLYAYIRAVKAHEEKSFVPEELRRGRKYAQVSIKAQHEGERCWIELSNKTKTPEVLALAGILEGLDLTDHEAVAYNSRVQEGMAEPAQAPDAPAEPDHDYRTMLSEHEPSIDLDAVPEGYTGAYPEQDHDEGLGDIRALLNTGDKK